MLIDRCSSIRRIRRCLVGTFALAPLLSRCGGQTDSPGGSSSTGGSIGLTEPSSTGGSGDTSTAVNLGPQSPSDCLLPPDPGPCSSGVQRYYFESKTSSCLPFNYGGCGGNGNNFLTQSQCSAFCVERLSCTCLADSKDCTTAFGCASCPDSSINVCVRKVECASPGLSCRLQGTYFICHVVDAGSSYWGCESSLGT